LLLDDLVFRLPRRATDTWELGEECLDFYKLKRLVDQYETFFGRRADFAADHLLELGIFGGGSMAFWYECFRPRKHVGIDIKRRTDSPYFCRFVASREAQERVKTYWGISQDDVAAVTRIVDTEFDGRLDLVIDDASHFYAPTRSSFQILFPFLRPGGHYIIEDWAWAHWRDVPLSPKFLARASQLTTLVSELVAAVGTNADVIRHIDVYQGFAVLERGPARLGPRPFDLDDHVYVRPRRAERAVGRIFSKSAQLLHRLRRPIA